MSRVVRVFVFLFLCCTISAFDTMVWPKPQTMELSTRRIYVDSRDFVILSNPTAPASTILHDAIVRYNAMLFPIPLNEMSIPQGFTRLIRAIVTITTDDMMLNIGTNEAYDIDFIENEEGFECHITAENCFGAMHGLETFSQLLSYSKNTRNGTNTCYTIMDAPLHISDAPRFPWRGLLIDTARHFSPIEEIERIIEGLSYCKMNVFHWHVTDSEAFPFASQTFPDLVKGAYTPKQVYTQSDVRHIIRYAYDRGVIVVPEIDHPGHSTSWGEGYPGSILPCVMRDIDKGILNITNPLAFDIVHGLTLEMSQIFSSFIHIGGDEVQSHCWMENEEFLAHPGWKDLAVDPTNKVELLEYYYGRIFEMLSVYNVSAVAWEEIQMSGIRNIPDNLIIQAWRAWGESGFQRALKSNHRTILSTKWYLDEFPTSERTWEHFYTVNEADLHFAETFPTLAIGGEACLWAELVQPGDREMFIWPNTAAIAERLWNTENHLYDAEKRLKYWNCHVLQRGVITADVDAGYCYIVDKIAEKISAARQNSQEKTEHLIEQKASPSTISYVLFGLVAMVFGAFISLILKKYQKSNK